MISKEITVGKKQDKPVLIELVHEQLRRFCVPTIDGYDENLVIQAVGYTIGHGWKQSDFNFENTSCLFDWYAQRQLYVVATTLGVLLDAELWHIKVKLETLLSHVKTTEWLSEDQRTTI